MLDLRLNELNMPPRDNVEIDGGGSDMDSKAKRLQASRSEQKHTVDTAVQRHSPASPERRSENVDETRRHSPASPARRSKNVDETRRHAQPSPRPTTGADASEFLTADNFGRGTAQFLQLVKLLGASDGDPSYPTRNAPCR